LVNSIGIASLACLTLILCSGLVAGSADAASSADLASASSAIAAGFLATHDAEKQGGNGSALTAKLDTALALVAAAQAENSTDPVAASAALANATQIAMDVQAQAPQVGHEGATASRTKLEESVGGASAILIVATLIYLLGESLFNRAWLYVYKDYLVSRTGDRRRS
jgi:hypothetical protein